MPLITNNKFRKTTIDIKLVNGGIDLHMSRSYEDAEVPVIMGALSAAELVVRAQLAQMTGDAKGLTGSSFF